MRERVERAGRVKPASGGGLEIVEENERKRLGKTREEGREREIDRTVRIERASAAAINIHKTEHNNNR